MTGRRKPPYLSIQARADGEPYEQSIDKAQVKALLVPHYLELRCEAPAEEGSAPRVLLKVRPNFPTYINGASVSGAASSSSAGPPEVELHEGDVITYSPSALYPQIVFHEALHTVPEAQKLLKHAKSHLIIAAVTNQLQDVKKMDQRCFAMHAPVIASRDDAYLGKAKSKEEMQIKSLCIALKTAVAGRIGASIDIAVRDGDDATAATLTKAKADLAAQGYEVDVQVSGERTVEERNAEGFANAIVLDD